MVRMPGNRSNSHQFLGVLRALFAMATTDFFRARLDPMIDLRHPLAVMATRMPWSQIDSNLAPVFAHRNRAGRAVEGSDLFGPMVALAGGGVSPAGRPRLSIRLMVGQYRAAVPEARLQPERRRRHRTLGTGRVLPIFQRPGVL